MKIKMLFTRYGSPDGFGVQRYEADEVYDVPCHLGCDFVQKLVAFSYQDESSQPSDAAKDYVRRIKERVYGDKFITALNQSSLGAFI